MVLTKKDRRYRRKKHIRKALSGTAEKPRVYVFKSNKTFYASVANDDEGKVLFGMKSTKGVEKVKKLGKKFATALKKKKIEIAVFDRSGYKYHGAITAFVEELRANGIKI